MPWDSRGMQKALTMDRTYTSSPTDWSLCNCLCIYPICYVGSHGVNYCMDETTPIALQTLLPPEQQSMDEETRPTQSIQKQTNGCSTENVKKCANRFFCFPCCLLQTAIRIASCPLCFFCCWHNFESNLNPKGECAKIGENSCDRRLRKWSAKNCSGYLFDRLCGLTDLGLDNEVQRDCGCCYYWPKKVEILRDI